MGAEGNDKTNARPESAQNNENVTIPKDCENEQEKNSGTTTPVQKVRSAQIQT